MFIIFLNIAVLLYFWSNTALVSMRLFKIWLVVYYIFKQYQEKILKKNNNIAIIWIICLGKIQFNGWEGIFQTVHFVISPCFAAVVWLIWGAVNTCVRTHASLVSLRV